MAEIAMREKLAKAMFDRWLATHPFSMSMRGMWNEGGHKHWLEVADAAFDALTEPTDAMVQAANEMWPDLAIAISAKTSWTLREVLPGLFRAMINTAKHKGK